MRATEKKSVNILRVAAISSMALLVCVAVAFSVRLSARDVAREAAQSALMSAAGDLAHRLRRLEIAGRDAAALLPRTDLFEQTADVFAAEAARGGAQGAARPRLLASADIVLREGRATLRRSRAEAFGPGAQGGLGAEAQAAAADAADALAKGLGDAVRADKPRALLWAAPLVSAESFGANAAPGPVFWAVWTTPAADRAFAALFALPPPPSFSARVIEATEITSAPRADEAAPPVLWGDAPLAGGAIRLSAPPPAPTLTAIDWRIAAPPVALAILIGFAFFLYARADRAQAARQDARHDEILRNIDAKQRELEASEERFRHLAESTNVIPWTADLQAQRFTYVGPQVAELSGYDQSAWLAHGFWAQHIHPSDRGRVMKAALERADNGQYATLHYRVRAANGRVLHIRNMLTIEKRASDEADAQLGDAARQGRVARGFMLDVTELRQAAAALEVARRKAEEANRVKSEFLANMSHELRTPLNAVIGFSEIMKEEIFGPLDPRYREYAESVHTSGQHLLELINDVLDLSKIEAGRIELIEEVCDVSGLLQECRTLLAERVAAAGLHEKLVLEPGLPKVFVDDRRIKQVVINLLSNAIKFTQPGGVVTLSAGRVEGRGVLIAVRDTGIGMAPQEIPRALSKFGQIDGELARKHEGTGLGLPIAKSLIEMHGGDLEIWSERGKGTEMRIWLPESRIAPDEHETAETAHTGY